MAQQIANIDVQKFVLLLKQTKLVSNTEISKIKVILRKMTKGQSLTLKQQAIYADIATKASVDPMTNNLALLSLTRMILKRSQGSTIKADKEAKAVESLRGVERESYELWKKEAKKKGYKFD